jgi:phosphoglycolate phosphatase
MSSQRLSEPLRAVLFDLDGTLVDSAPDLAGAGNEMRAARGLPVLPFEAFRPMVGSGARGMLGVALQMTPDDVDFPVLRDEFLQRYEARMTSSTKVFATVLPLLEALAALDLPWGIVTNKAERFAVPLTRALGLMDQAATLVCGDTTPRAKPHPEPLLEAARRLRVEPAACVYVGDDLRDVLAGRAAAMSTVAAAWGYLGSGEPIGAWGADHVIAEPVELLDLLPLKRPVLP